MSIPPSAESPPPLANSNRFNAMPLPDFKQTCASILGRISLDKLNADAEFFTLLELSTQIASGDVDPQHSDLFVSEFLVKICKAVLLRIYPDDASVCSRVNMLIQRLLDVVLIHLKVGRIEAADALVELFRDATIFYLNHGNEHVNRLVAEPLDSDELRAWRSTLSATRWVDALAQNRKWYHAQLLDCEEADCYNVVFTSALGAESVPCELISVDSTRLAPLNSYTQRPISAWKLELTANSAIDVLDTQKKWYTGRVLEVRGDELLVTLNGWSSNFDEWLPRHSDRLGKLNSHARGGKEFGGDRYIPSLVPVLDSYGEPADAAIFRGPGYGSSYLVDNISYFVANDGVDAVFAALDAQPNVPMIRSLLNAWSNPLALLTRRFAEQLLPRLVDSAFTALLNLTESQLRVLTKEQVDEIQKVANSLFRRVLLYSEAGERTERFALSMALRRLNSANIERRLNGMATLLELVKGCRRSAYMEMNAWLTGAALVAWLAEEKVLEDIFSAKKGHLELMRRSSEFFRLLCTETALQTSHLDLVWDAMERAMRRNETAELEVLYKVMDDIAWQLETGQLDYLFQRLRRIPFSEYLLATVDLVKELSRFTYKAGIAAAINSMDLLWALVTDETVSAELANHARLRLSEILIMSSVREERMTIARRCIEHIAAGKSVTHCLRVLSSVLDACPIETMPSEPIQRSVAALNISCDETTQRVWYRGSNGELFHGALIALLLRELEEFNQSVAAKSVELELRPEQIDSFVFGSHVSFVESIKERLAVLHSVLKAMSPRITLDTEQIKLFWRVMYQQALTSAQQDQCVAWLRQAAGSGPGSGHVTSGVQARQVPSLISSTAIQYLFETFLTVDLMPQYIAVSGFECVARYFLLVNAHSPASTNLVSAMTGESLNKVQFLSFGSDRNDFVVHDFTALIGLDYIWQLALETANQQVFPLAIEFLNRLHENVSDEASLAAATRQNDSPVADLASIRSAYLSRCFAHIDASTASNNLAAVSRGLAMLCNTLDSSEQRGAGGAALRSHGAMLRGPLLTFSIHNSIMMKGGAGTQGPAKFEVICRSNESLWELRQLISAQIGLPPDQLKLLTAGRELKLDQSAQALAQLKLTDRQAIAVSKFIPVRVPLTTGSNQKDAQLVPACKRALFEVFNQFASVDEYLPIATTVNDSSDDELPASSPDSAETEVKPTRLVRFMTKADMARYIQACKAPAHSWAIDRLRSIFAEFGVSADRLSAEGFLQFYVDACFDRPHAVWDDLTTHGYRGDLRREADVIAKQAAAASGVEVTAESLLRQMPRCIISSQQSYFDSLFRLLELQDSGNIAETAWSLLMRLPTDPGLRASFASLRSPVDWSALFPVESPHKFLYSLQIVDYLAEHCVSDSNSLSQWRADFVELGGLTSLHQILLARSNSAASSVAEWSSTTLLLKIMSSFLVVAFVASDDSIIERFNAVSQSDNTDLKSVSPVAATPAVKDEFDFGFDEEPASSPGTSSIITSASPQIESDQNAVELLRSTAANVSPQLMASTLSSVSLVSLQHCLLNLLSHCSFPNAIGADSLCAELTESVRSLWLYLCLHQPSLLSVLVSLGQDAQSIMCTALHSYSGFARRNVSLCLHQLTKIPQPEAGVNSFILDALLSFVTAGTQSVGCTDSEELFALLSKLLREDSQTCSSRSARDLSSLLLLLVGRLKTETAQKSIAGLCNLLETLCSQNVEFRAFVGTASLDRIFGQMLFTTDESDTQHVPLCQSPSSRRAAFALLAVLVKCEPNDESAANNSVAEVRQSLLWKLEPQLTPSLRLSGWGYEPTSQHRAALVGLKNQSSTCYMNSLLQQLFMIPPFRSGILSAQIAETDEEALADNLLYQFQRMFAHLTLSERHAFDTLQFCLAYKDENGQPINVRLQQDVLEFFNVFCDRIERGLKGGAQEKLIHDVFGGKLANQRLCLGGCESMRQNDEDFYSVSLDVKNHRSMLSSLSEYVTGETISDFNCETCGRKTDIIKRGCLLNLHQTVIFHLKRFEFDFSTFQHEKLNVRFEFPLSIDLEPFTKEGLERKDHEQKQQKAREQGQQTAESLDPYRLHPAAYYQYDLVGVLVHTGTATGGHYYSFAKQRDSASTPDALSQWFELNDSTVRPFDLQNLDEECFGGDSESTETNAFGSPFTRKTERYKSAYMLIYERRSIKSVCQTQAASLIAPTLEKAIKEDNMCMRRDLELYSSEFFDFMHSVLHSMPALTPLATLSVPDELASEHLPPMAVVRLATRYAFHMLTRSTAPVARVAAVLDRIRVLIADHVPAMMELLSSLAADLNCCTDLALACRENHVRSSFCSLVSTCLIQCAAVELPIVFYDGPSTPSIRSSLPVTPSVLSRTTSGMRSAAVSVPVTPKPVRVASSSAAAAAPVQVSTEAAPDNFIEPEMDDRMSTGSDRAQLGSDADSFVADTRDLQNSEDGDIDEQIMEWCVKQEEEENLQRQYETERQLQSQLENLELSESMIDESLVENIQQSEHDSDICSQASVAYRFVRTWMSMLNASAAKHWMRFDQYFSVLHAFAASGELPRMVLAMQCTAERLLDFMLDDASPIAPRGRKSAGMGNRMGGVPNFDNLLAAVALLVRCTRTTGWQAAIEQGVAASNERPQFALPGRMFALTDGQFKILTDNTLYQVCLSEQYGVISIADIVAHWSWRWSAYSDAVISIVLEGIRKSNEHGVAPYFQVLLPFLQLDDGLQSRRVQTLLQGLVTILQQYSTGHSRFLHASVERILDLIDQVPAVLQAWLELRHEWCWLDSWLHGRANTASVVVVTSPSNSTDTQPSAKSPQAALLDRYVSVLQYGGLELDLSAEAAVVPAEPSSDADTSFVSEPGTSIRVFGPQPASPAVSAYPPGGQAVNYPIVAVAEAASTNTEPWPCPTCTYENAPGATVCDICGWSGQ